MKNWTCKQDKHNECNSKILDGNIMTGVTGIKTCTCKCHPKPKSWLYDILGETPVSDSFAG
jgi:hypothetical protein